MKLYLALGLFAFLLTGCAAKTKYYWGSYEELLYDQYNSPGKATPEYQIEKLEKDVQRAKSKGLPLPPGFFAHLAYQYLQAGNAREANICFNREKASFPESATLINRFTKKLK